MTVARQLTLPNGYTLPLALVLERCVTRETEQKPIPEMENQALLTAASRRLALRDAIAGEILKEDLRFQRCDGCDTLLAVTECREMIAGRRQSLQIEGETTNDGTGSQR